MQLQLFSNNLYYIIMLIVWDRIYRGVNLGLRIGIGLNGGTPNENWSSNQHALIRSAELYYYLLHCCIQSNWLNWRGNGSSGWNRTRTGTAIHWHRPSPAGLSRVRLTASIAQITCLFLFLFLFFNCNSFTVLEVVT